MTEEYKIRLERLGIDPSKPITLLFEDVLNLAEFLYAEMEITEIERFERELNRNLKPTN